MEEFYLAFALAAAVIAIWAQFKVKISFSKYQNVYSENEIRVFDAARRILDENGLEDVAVERVAGSLTDHYDPSARVIRLSDSVYSSRGISAIGVAAHEAGHAIQHALGYVPLKIRNSVYPAVNISSQAAVPLIILGFVLDSLNMVYAGIILFSAVVAFQLITLPVEFDASRRALKILSKSGIMSQNELKDTKKVLSAAAMTYVASALAAVAQLLRFLMTARRKK